MVRLTHFKLGDITVLAKAKVRFKLLERVPIVQFPIIWLLFLQEIEQWYHLARLPVRELAANHWVLLEHGLGSRLRFLRPAAFLRRRYVSNWALRLLYCDACWMPEFLENSLFLAKAKLEDFLAFLLHTRSPEDVAFHFTLTKPAWIFLLDEHLPLLGTWNLKLVAKVPCENHLASMSDKLVFCRAVLNQTLISLYVLDLDCLSEPLLLIIFKSFRLQKLKNI